MQQDDIPTLVYVLRSAGIDGEFKVGKHTGTRKQLLARYATYINPEIILIYRSVNYSRVEHEFHKLLDTKRIIREGGFDSCNTKSEWYNLPLSEILTVLLDLIKRDEAGEFGDNSTKMSKRAAHDSRANKRRSGKRMANKAANLSIWQRLKNLFTKNKFDQVIDDDVDTIDVVVSQPTQEPLVDPVVLAIESVSITAAIIEPAVHKYGFRFDLFNNQHFDKLSELRNKVHDNLGDVLNWLRNSVVYIESTDVFIVRLVSEQGHHSVEYYKPKQFYNKLKNVDIVFKANNLEGFVNKAKKDANNSVVVLVDKIIREYKSIITRNNEVYTIYSPLSNFDVLYNPTQSFNKFTGFPLAYNAVNQIIKSDAVAVFLEHVRNIIANSNMQCYEYILNWLAHAVQKPNIKIDVLLALFSKEEQTCKNMFINTLVNWIFGSELATETSDINDVLGRRRELMAKKLLICLNDMTFHNDRDVAGKVNSLHIENTNMSNYSNYIICTNNEQFLKSDCGDNKLVVMSVSARKVDDSTYLDLYSNTVNTLTGATAVYNYLMHRNIGEWNPADIPIVVAVVEPCILDTFEQWCCAVKNGKAIIAKTTHIAKTGDPRTPIALMHDSYQTWLKTCDQHVIQSNCIKNSHQLSERLVKIGYTVEKRMAGGKGAVLSIEGFDERNIHELADKLE
jgi:hypothetical protein